MFRVPHDGAHPLSPSNSVLRPSCPAALQPEQRTDHSQQQVGEDEDDIPLSLLRENDDDIPLSLLREQLQVGHSPVSDTTVSDVFNEMASFRISIPKFRGLSDSNPEQFLSDFCSYLTLHSLKGDDARIIAAFQLHLEGPALTWFNNLPPSENRTWATVKQDFESKYINIDFSKNPALLAETELFNTMKLAPHQAIDQFHADRKSVV